MYMREAHAFVKKMIVAAKIIGAVLLVLIGYLLGHIFQ